jgi:anti-sigma factor (TIGR02949 family)
MDCRTATNLLQAYLDGELDRDEARALEAHVDACADCRAEQDRLDALRRALRDGSLRHAAPAALRARIAASAQVLCDEAGTTPTQSAAMPRARARIRVPWLNLAAACVLAFAAGAVSLGAWNAMRAPQADASAQLAHDLFSSHWRALAAASPFDVASSDRHTVKPWFAGKVAQSPSVRDFADAGFPLAGGRVDYVGGTRVPVLVYRHGQHVIDVYVLPPGAPALAAPQRERGYSIAPATLAGERAAIVSDADPQELARFATLIAGVE